MHLFIEMPPDALDVNVHPTKAEVRFREQSLVHEVVRRALMEALGASGVPQLQLAARARSVNAPAACSRCPDVLGGGAYPTRSAAGATLQGPPRARCRSRQTTSAGAIEQP